MHHLDLILTLTGGLGAALLLGLITQKLGLSPIVGYLLAGVVLSPNTPGYVAHADLAKEMADIGVILLMFGVGLHFHFRELLAVRRIAVPGALVQSTVATGLSMLLLKWVGLSWAEGAVFGMAISVASTVVLTRILVDNNHLHTPTGHIAIGWLVVEDIITVFILVLLPAVFGASAGGETAAGSGLVMAFLWTALKMGAFVAFTFAVGGRVIPRLLGYIANTRSRELFTLGVLVVALGIAVGATKLFGVSMELGAFLAGMVVARSDFSTRAATDALPMKDAFAVLFFVSVGMLFDLKSLLESPMLVIITLGIVIVGKPAAAIAITLALRYPLRVALSVGAVLAQIGEFSFIVGSLGHTLGIVSQDAFNALVATAIISITLTPLFYRTVVPLERWAMRQPWLRPYVDRAGDEGTGTAIQHLETKHHAIVVGYGPVGQTVVRLLQENDVEPVVLEMNINTVQRLKGQGLSAWYGDAAHPETLKKAGIEKARVLILSSSGMGGAGELIREARRMNPKIRILARTSYLREAAQLLAAGADSVFSGEGEVALSMTEYILEEMSATPEQIDRERERIRKELFATERQAQPAH